MKELIFIKTSDRDTSNRLFASSLYSLPPFWVFIFCLMCSAALC